MEKCKIKEEIIIKIQCDDKGHCGLVLESLKPLRLGEITNIKFPRRTKMSELIAQIMILECKYLFSMSRDELMTKHLSLLKEL